MKIKLEESKLTVTREPGDPKFYNGGKGSWGSAESRLMYHIKKTLSSAGHDVIKKHIQDDGHLYGNGKTQYIRSRLLKKGEPYMMIYDGMWALRQLHELWNEQGEVSLIVVRRKYGGKMYSL